MDAGGGWRLAQRMDRKKATYLPLTAEVVSAHLVGDVFIGLYPLLADNSCHFLVADFDGPAAMLDALAYCKAARASAVPAASEISQSGRGAHVWVLFTGAVPAAVARRVGTALGHTATSSSTNATPSPQPPTTIRSSGSQRSSGSGSPPHPHAVTGSMTSSPGNSDPSDTPSPTTRPATWTATARTPSSTSEPPTQDP